MNQKIMYATQLPKTLQKVWKLTGTPTVFVFNDGGAKLIVILLALNLIQVNLMKQVLNLVANLTSNGSAIANSQFTSQSGNTE